MYVWQLFYDVNIVLCIVCVCVCMHVGNNGY